MPWLYSGPSDNLCQLRGVEEDHGESIHGGGEEEGGETGKFWDGSRDRWVSVVSTRINPDAVFNPPPYSHAARGLLSTASSSADAELTPRTAIFLWCVQGDLRLATIHPAHRIGFITMGRWCVQVTNQLGLLPRHEVQVPPEDVDAESEANAK